VLLEVIDKANLMKEERKLSSGSANLVLILVHDLLLARGIQAGDGPIKQAILRHKTRLHGEFQKIKIKRGATANDQLAHNGDERAGDRISTRDNIRLLNVWIHSTHTSLCSREYDHVILKRSYRIFCFTGLCPVGSLQL
jgi:hypothetical protein